MSQELKNPTRLKYGILGLDVGRFRRWLRLFVGFLYLIPIVLSLLTNPKTLSILTQSIVISKNVTIFYLELLIYFIIILVLYIVTY